MITPYESPPTYQPPVRHLPHPFPDWATERLYVNRFEMNFFKHQNCLEGWQHPNQKGPVPRPDGHDILQVIEAKFLDRVIGLKTLLYYQKNPDQRGMFENIDMYGWLDVVKPPYPQGAIDPKKPSLFVPVLTPGDQPQIQWRGLSTGHAWFDYVPIRRRS